MGNRRLQQRPSWQRSLKRCSKIAAHRQTNRVCPTLYPPNLSFFLIWLFENGTSQTQNRLKTWFCLIKKSLLLFDQEAGSALMRLALLLFSRYYSVSNAIFQADLYCSTVFITCTAIHIISCRRLFFHPPR